MFANELLATSLSRHNQLLSDRDLYYPHHGNVNSSSSSSLHHTGRSVSTSYLSPLSPSSTIRPLSFRCKTAEMLNLAIDDNVEERRRCRRRALRSLQNLHDNEDEDDTDSVTRYERALQSLNESMLKNFDHDDWSLTNVTDTSDVIHQSLTSPPSSPFSSPFSSSFSSTGDQISIMFNVNIRIDRIQIHWHELRAIISNNNNANVNSLSFANSINQYCLYAHLLNESPLGALIMTTETIEHQQHHHRHPLKSTSIETRQIADSLTENITDDGHTLTDIHFDQSIRFTSRLSIMQTTTTTGSRKEFYPLILRLELQRHKSSDDNSDKQLRRSSMKIIDKMNTMKNDMKFDHRKSIGFVDIDLSEHIINDDDNSNDRCIPMVFYSRFDRSITKRTMQRQRSEKNRGNLTMNLLANVDMCSVDDADRRLIENIAKRRKRKDMSEIDPKHLEYHDPPRVSMYRHLLNVIGVSPPGDLYRVSIHFGNLEHLVLSNSIHSIYATFEVENVRRHPMAYRFLHRSSSLHTSRTNIANMFMTKDDLEQQEKICCRTRRLASCCFDHHECCDFNQRFTFFERFDYHDSPPTILAIRCGDNGRKLFSYHAPLSEYVDCASSKQYFHLIGRRARTKRFLQRLTRNHHECHHCRLQFSITVSLIEKCVK